MKAINAIRMGGVDVLPLVEGGKGVSVSNGASCGAWAASGGVGTFSAVNADTYDAAFAAKGASLDPARREKLNALLRDIDQLLLDPRGLPGRPWFRNMIYAPGAFTGYGVKTLPGLREAIEERRFADADLYAERIGKVLRDYADRLDKARAVIEAR